MWSLDIKTDLSYYKGHEVDVCTLQFVSILQSGCPCAPGSELFALKWHDNSRMCVHKRYFRDTRVRCINWFIAQSCHYWTCQIQFRTYTVMTLLADVLAPEGARPSAGTMMPTGLPLQWRNNEHDGVSNHRRDDCLLNSLFRRRSKKISKLCVTGLFEGNSPLTDEFPTQRASNAENVPIWWRHHA